MAFGVDVFKLPVQCIYIDNIASIYSQRTHARATQRQRQGALVDLRMVRPRHNCKKGWTQEGRILLCD